MIIGLLIISFLIMLVGFYLMFPKINEEKYSEIISEEPKEVETWQDSMVGTPYLRSFEDITKQIESLMHEQVNLQNKVDSLNNLKENLISNITELETNMQEKKSGQAEQPIGENVPLSNTMQTESSEQPQTLFADNKMTPQEVTEEDQEAFADRVKSFLNLEEEELAPILTKMDNDQIVRLYHSAGNIQREKLLRSLNPDRAARLMESIML